MNVVRLLDSPVAKKIRNCIKDKNTVFVFNTNISAASWSDFVVNAARIDSDFPAAIAEDRFVAWDDFKGNILKIKKEDYSSIGGIERKFFARSLLARIKNNGFLLESLIPKKYASYAFTDWIAKILPALDLLHKKLAERGIPVAGEFDDYEKLYNEYSAFLERKKLFEPSWQSGSFEESGKHYIIVFPELLEDFEDYRALLDENHSDYVHLAEKDVKADKYKSIRTEIRIACMRIREYAESHETDGRLSWTDTALVLPDYERLIPYVERDLKLYKIPYVLRSGRKLGDTSAGRIFHKFQDCVQNKFSYESVRALALDANIPWKNPESLEELIKKGGRAKCLCTYRDENNREHDPWKRINLPVYDALKLSVTAIVRAKSFVKMRSAWFAFRETFISEEKFLAMPDVNNIFSRCIASLNELVSIEKKYRDEFNFEDDLYSFFLTELDSTQYKSQEESDGVSVFDYRTSAGAAIPFQIVLNASQNNMSLISTRLPFLSASARRRLFDPAKNEREEIDLSKSYLYAYSSSGQVSFSFSENGLGEFNIPYTGLEAVTPDYENLDEKDFIRRERDWLSGFGNFPGQISDLQKKTFDLYYKRSGAADDRDRDSFANEDLKKKELTVTASQMNTYFACPLKWILQTVLKVDADTLDIDLYENTDMGNINHKALELFLKKRSGESLPETSTVTGKFSEDVENSLRKELFDVFDRNNRSEGQWTDSLGDTQWTPFAAADSYRRSSFFQNLCDLQTGQFVEVIMNFLHWFCRGSDFDAGERMFGGWTVEKSEWSSEKLPYKDFFYQGRIDCVLRSPTDKDKFAIIDFKNTKSALPDGKLSLRTISADGKSQIDYPASELKDFQIPMYVTLWEAEECHGTKSIAEARFLPINTGSSVKMTKVITEGKTRKGSYYVPRDKFDLALDAFNRRAEYMVKNIRRGMHPLEEIEIPENCTKGIACPYSSICRSLYNSAACTVIPAETKTDEEA